MITSLLRSKAQAEEDTNSWKRRPLSENMKNYCYLNTAALFSLYNKLNVDGGNHSRLLVASERYANTLRSLSERTYGDFDGHPILPLDIIPGTEKSFEFPIASTKCVRCHRRFPEDEFPVEQLTNQQRYCRVCTNADHSFMFVDNTADFKRALSKISGHDLLAVNCKGFRLWHGRSGDLTVITIATPDKVFIFDVQQLGQRVFDDGLRDILEDITKEKLMFDCRRDADNLLHRQKVRLAGILDLQLLDVMHRNRRAPESDDKGPRRSTKTGDVQLLNGILRCIKVYIKDETMIESKTRCQKQVIGDRLAWKTRPLSENLKKYCCIDTAALFVLYKKLKGGGENHCRLLVASERYADTFRCWPEKAFGVFQAHPFLPLDIIPGTSDTFQFPEASTKCLGCLRLFPVEEFSKAQLRDKNRYCRVCRKAKSDSTQKPSK
ncbi:piRNA biogenesis protein EXD1-like [Argopecten irradians]|uniref:piRNA biogenesis protein EXD1-like n=1 Tax=Argopecten irradians TaxID=31199 RepID=UPI00372331E0